MKHTNGTKILSLLLALVMVLGLVVTVSPSASAAYDTTVYAPPASAEDIAAVPRWFAGNDGALASGSFMKVVNGEIYCWGANSGGVLGPVGSGNILSPTKIPRSYFGDEDVVLLKMSYNGAAAVTESGQVYVWGSSLPIYFGGTSGQTTPLAIDMGDLATALGKGAQVTYLFHTASVLYVGDSNGDWYTAGYNNNGNLFQLDKTARNKLTKVPDALYTDYIRADGDTSRTIVAMTGGITTKSFLLTSDGKLWAVGADSGAEHQLGLGKPGTYVTPQLVSAPGEPLGNVRIVSMTSEDQGWAGIDENGDVWAFGSSNHYRFGKPDDYDGTGKDLGNYALSPNITKPIKIYDHLAFNGGIKKRAVAVGLSYYHTYVLAEDNTVYAMGYNINSMITKNTAALSIPEMTQTLKSVSETDTIVGFVINNNCAMAVTKAGDMLFVGSNATGGAGTGDTQNSDSGEPTKVEPPTLPPAEPQTANEVIFEVQTEDGATYRADPSDPNGKLLKTENKVTTSIPVDALEVAAGKTIKLNVYFNDFGKLGSFYMPIRFDPQQLQVVNSAGKAYTNAAGSVFTVSSLSGSGITQHFNSQTWNGGYLIVGSKTNTYPKICNTDGWVSIAGYSDNHYAAINGEVKMFSVDFMVQKTGTVKFDYATSKNIPEKNSTGGPITVDNAYDKACDILKDNNFGPYWMIRNPKAENLSSAFPFNPVKSSPVIKTRYVPVSSINKMRVTYGSGQGLTEIDPQDDNKVHINWNNSDTVYTVRADTLPTNASFPAVTWTYELDTTGRTDNRTTEDFISIVETGDTYLRFKMVDNASFTENVDQPADLHFNATSVYNSSLSNSITVRAESFAAPENIKILEKTTLNTDTFVYNYRGDDGKHSNTAPTTFHVDYGLDGELPTNPQVQWKLLDQDRNELNMNDPAIKIALSGVVSGGGTDKKDYHASIDPRFTTPDGTYYILRVESVIDPTKGDEVILKTQMYASQLEFSQETIRMAVNTERDLSQLLNIAPLDVYATDITWSILSTPEVTSIPANWDNATNGEYDPDTPVLYASLRNATVSSYEWGTPRQGFNSMSKDEYVVVQAMDNYSGESAFIKVQVLALNCPIPISDFEVKNELGYSNDVLIVKSGLQEGDVLKIYRNYTDGTPEITTDPLTKAQIPNGYGIFSLALSDTSGLLAGGSGEIAVQLERDGITLDLVPVPYNAEPSKVQGYVRLLGRDMYSEFNEGIQVYLSGTKYQGMVETTSGGYFVFNEYVAPGTYNMTISKPNYLSRLMTVSIKAAEEFNISVQNDPIYLYPGEMTGDNMINTQDINYYVSNWLGIYDSSVPNFSAYNFDETYGTSINGMDLEMILMRKDWVRASYPAWTVPNQ